MWGMPIHARTKKHTHSVVLSWGNFFSPSQTGWQNTVLLVIQEMQRTAPGSAARLHESSETTNPLLCNTPANSPFWPPLFYYRCNYLWRLVTYLQRNVYVLFSGLVFTRIHTKIRNCCCLSMQSPTNREWFLIHTIFDTFRGYCFTYILEWPKSISQRHIVLLCSRQS